MLDVCLTLHASLLLFLLLLFVCLSFFAVLSRNKICILSLRLRAHVLAAPVLLQILQLSTTPPLLTLFFSTMQAASQLTLSGRPGFVYYAIITFSTLLDHFAQGRIYGGKFLERGWPPHCHVIFV